MVVPYLLTPFLFDGFYPEFREQDISKSPLILYIVSDIYGKAWLLLQGC
jgi:hypothetical protein